jgi:hypothetical protein
MITSINSCDALENLFREVFVLPFQTPVLLTYFIYEKVSVIPACLVHLATRRGENLSSKKDAGQAGMTKKYN